MRKIASRRGRIMIYVDRGEPLLDCWLSDWKYVKIDGGSIYRRWARGEGEVVRHLCGDNRCINPLHLLRGTEFENAYDEIEARDFITEYFEDMTNDHSLRDLPKDVAHLIIVPRASVFMRKQGSKPMELTEVIKIGREAFRAKKSYEIAENFDQSLVPLLEDKLTWLENRYDVYVHYTAQL